MSCTRCSRMSQRSITAAAAASTLYSMSIPRGVTDSNGFLVKALPSGEPWPLQSGLTPLFKESKVDTLPGALKYSANLRSDKECMATRKVLERHRVEKDGKTFEKLTLGDYQWLTYSEVEMAAESVKCALSNMNFQTGDRIAIFAETRAEWFIAAMGALKLRVSVCTIYTTLSDKGIIHVLNEVETNLVFTSFDLLPRMKSILDQCPKVKEVVVMEDQLEGVGNKEYLPKNVKIIPFSEMTDRKNTKISKCSEVVPQPDDVAIIMYTSGSTGTPKGVELTHTNILAAAIGYSVQISIDENDRYLAFLPLAHIMELATETALISIGVTIYYSSPHTLTSTGAKIAKGSVGDAKLAKPTVINVVPLLLDRIIKGVTQAVEKQGWIKSAVFNTLVAYKYWLDYIPLSSRVLNFLIFQKVRDELGGQLKRVIAGGAPLSPQTHNNFKAIFGCTIQVGYGSTETASLGTGMNEDDDSTGHCGGPCLNALLKLDDWEEGNYRTTDLPFPRGEIVIGGVSIAKGYFKNAAETKNAFYEENGIRWFRTGDIAEIDNTGCVKIIDRKKDLVKLKHGEYVALGNAETILKTLNVVDNMCIFADSTQDKVVAVVVPVLDVLRKLAAGVGITNPDLTLVDLCENDKVNMAVLKELQVHGRRCGLTRWEIPAAVHLTDELWTPDTGLVTAALKLRRKQLDQQYRSMVVDMYSRLAD
ncbi:long-chain-fatty-acid--CoA ligase 4 isoform X2 [Hyalella azteca]|uniref:long-chain-fatty-acid--CoA ligase n=1 Tax=Hyalella azteca TaxID=294128 RepID=A0A8B7PI00_HYAAZ|nr:long-chain-fatty-acid--CoA ligase 4 isoform X2 [Hyalella azteca]